MCGPLSWQDKKFKINIKKIKINMWYGREK